jgi:hypothetical protein
VVWEKHGAPSRIKKGFVELEIRLEGSRSGESILCFSARKVEGGLWTSGKAKNWVIGRGIRSEIEKKAPHRQPTYFKELLYVLYRKVGTNNVQRP